VTHVKHPNLESDKGLRTRINVPLSMCVIHQVNADNTEGALANFVIGGVSVCVDHLKSITALLVDREDFWIDDAVDAVLAESMEE